MRRFFYPGRIFRLTVAATALVGLCLSAYALYLRSVDAWLLPAAPLVRAEQLAAEGRWAEAKMIADFVVEHPYLGDVDAAHRLSSEAEYELNSFSGKGRRFLHGAISGEPVDTVSMLGSLSLDLFVVGDVRDLAVQGWKEFHDGSGDELILALSAVGLVTTVSPQLDWAPALVKAMKKSGALSLRLQAQLTNLARRAWRSGDFAPLRRAGDDLGHAATALGPGPLRGALAHVDSTDELRRLSRSARVDPGGTYFVVSMYGREGVEKLGRTGTRIVPLSRSIKRGSRLVKAVYKWSAFVSVQALLFVFMLCCAVLVWCVRGRRRRFRTAVLAA